MNRFERWIDRYRYRSIDIDRYRYIDSIDADEWEITSNQTE